MIKIHKNLNSNACTYDNLKVEKWPEKLRLK